MTHLETAIRDAVEKGGYQPHMHGFKEWKSFTFQTAQAFVMSQGIECILFDPAFWRALGKARGWEEGIGKLPNGMTFGQFEEQHWTAKQHRFITHLQNDGDIEGFFASLATNN